jgi:hypothetical protein
MNSEGQRNRVDDLEISQRIMQIAKYVLQGYSKRAFLMQKISDEHNNWELGERQIDNYIKSAKDLIKNSFSENELEFEKDIAVNRLESLFTMNMKIQDYREARNVTMDRMKLLGLLIEKSDLSSKDGSMSPKTLVMQYKGKDIDLGD